MQSQRPISLVSSPAVEENFFFYGRREGKRPRLPDISPCPFPPSYRIAPYNFKSRAKYLSLCYCSMKNGAASKGQLTGAVFVAILRPFPNA
jgi:hypothetical protein